MKETVTFKEMVGDIAEVVLINFTHGLLNGLKVFSEMVDDGEDEEADIYADNIIKSLNKMVIEMSGNGFAIADMVFDVGSSSETISATTDVLFETSKDLAKFFLSTAQQAKIEELGSIKLGDAVLAEVKNVCKKSVEKIMRLFEGQED